MRDDHVRAGVLHAQNERDARADSRSTSRAVGRDDTGALVWRCTGGMVMGALPVELVREARTRSILVMAPTSRDRTWSIMGGGDVDAEPLLEMIASVAARYRSTLARAADGCPTARPTRSSAVCARDAVHYLARSAASCIRFLLAPAARRLPAAVYIVHGALDWMFPSTPPPHTRSLESRWAHVVYREIEDLSHTIRVRKLKDSRWLIAND